MSQNVTPASQASSQAESKKPNLRWRVNEIVIAAVIAVACAVIFWIWDIAVGPAAKTALVAAPEFRPIVAGAWLLGGTLSGLLIRKPGAHSSVKSSQHSSPCSSPAARGAAKS